MEALDKATFPNLSVLFLIGATLPITSTTCERSINTLHFLKDELRSTMTNKRLNGLSLMFIRCDLTKNDIWMSLPEVHGASKLVKWWCRKCLKF